MAKILQRKMKLGIDASRPNLETVVNVCYDSTDKETRTYSRQIPDERFYIKLPQVVADSLGEDMVRGKDQNEVMELFEAALELFKKLKTEVSKVILFDIATSPEPGEKTYGYDWHGISVRVWASGYEESVAIAGDGQKRYSYQHIDSVLDFPGSGAGSCRGPARYGKRYDKQIPWTESNEVFFVWVKERMTELADRLAELVKPSALLETINEGRLSTREDYCLWGEPIFLKK